MRSALFALCVLVTFTAAQLRYPQQNDSPIWKVFCNSNPIFRGRLDSIVNPGTYSGHVHKVFGGSNFSPSHKGRSPLEEFDITHGAPCTSCSIGKVDNSNYWTPDLYYRWDDGTYSLVPNSGLTIYYLSRAGETGRNRTYPDWQPIPKGLRMLAGNPFRRTYNSKSVKDNAVSYVCLNYNGGGFPQANDWSGLANYHCPDGLRAQVWFPMCWDGKNLDSPDHQSHMSYPVNSQANPQGGDCPMSHPVRIPGLFFEHLYSLDGFPHGDGKNRFLWSCGDPTGYGFHGDFVSGWEPDVMRSAIKHPQCSNSNRDMAYGNNVKACPPLAPYVKDNNGGCSINKPIPLTENLGMFNPLSRLPGCYGSDGFIGGCDTTPQGSDNAGSYYMYSVSHNAYITIDKRTLNLFANASSHFLTYNEVWGFKDAGNGKVYIMNAGYSKVTSAQNVATLVSRESAWEQWDKITLNNDQYAFRSSRTNRYLSVNGDRTLSFNANNIGNSETFKITVVTGGYVPEYDGLDGYIKR